MGGLGVKVQHFPLTMQIAYSCINQENSAKLKNQRVSYAFTSSPFSIHVRHILPTSKFQHSYFTFFYVSEQHV